jgi:transglutaminase-like putative cysteine protease
MLFQITHLTRYRYSTPVTLGEHILRFHPRADGTRRVTRCDLSIKPVPVYGEDGIDAWGNTNRRVTFQGQTDLLEIYADLEVETDETCVPELPGPGSALPPRYGTETAALAPYLQAPEAGGRLRPFVDPLLAEAGDDLPTFLNALNGAIHRFYHRGIRLSGAPRTPAETIALGEGVCRDLTVLFMAACRQAGIAARFVSGYQQGDGTRQLRYLHAWPEVLLPGRGWYGYDPTHNSIVGADHVAVAAAPEPAAVTPVEGGYSFSGPEVTSTLETEIRITTG